MKIKLWTQNIRINQNGRVSFLTLLGPRPSLFLKSIIGALIMSWFKIHRDLQYNWLWQIKPFSKGQAWVDLIMIASHCDKTFSYGGEPINIHRGEIITSEVKLMDKWGWSKSKVRKFLETLQRENMIELKKDRKKTTIQIVKYSVYQCIETTERPQKNHGKTTKRHNQEDKEGKEEKNKDYISWAKETIDHLNLKTGKHYRYGEKNLKLIIARFNEGYSLDDWKYVIDIKTPQWLGDKKNDRYLNFETLSRHFEKYRNEKKPDQLKDKSKPSNSAPPEPDPATENWIE